jgi:hypothetical protein
LKSFVCIINAIQFLCAFAVVYTWIKVKSLHETLANAVTVLTTIAYAVGAVLLSVPLLAGRNSVLCSSDDVITHFLNGPTRFCTVQGALIHFSLLCAGMFFLGSVFNVTAAVLTFTTDSIFKRRAGLVFVIECVVAVAVPGSLVGYTAGTSGYTDDMILGDLSSFWCYFDNGKTAFFTFILPIQIVFLSTTMMVLLIIRRLRQVSVDFSQRHIHAWPCRHL